MNINFSNKLNYFLIFLILFFLYLEIVTKKVLLTDDLGRVFEPIYGIKNYNIFSFVTTFMDQISMTSRPISGFFYSVTLYLTQFHLYYYYLNYLFFLISAYSIYNLISLKLDNKNALLGTIIYIVLPIGSSTIYSPIMMNSSLATIFFCYSIKNAILDKLVLSSFLFVLSILCYEIFIPLILIFFFINNAKIMVKLLFIACTLLIILTYRELIEPSLFNNYFHRDNIYNVFNIERDVYIFHKIFEIPYLTIIGVGKGIRAISFFSFLDYIILMIIMIIASIIVFESKSKPRGFNKKTLLLFLISLFLSFIVFFITNYKPIIYGFSNRNLGAVKLFSSLIIFNIISLINNNYIRKISLLFIIFIFSITSISMKNAWVYSQKVNDKIFTSLKNNLPKDDKTIPIFIKINSELIHKDKHFVLREPIFLESWEAFYLSKSNRISQDYRINYFNSNNIHDISEPYYLFDYQENKIILVNK